MADSGSAFRNQHDISNIDEKDPDAEIKTPEDQDDDFIENADASNNNNTNLDFLHNQATGREDNRPFADEVDEEEISRVKDLDVEPENSQE